MLIKPMQNSEIAEYIAGRSKDGGGGCFGGARGI